MAHSARRAHDPGTTPTTCPQTCHTQTCSFLLALLGDGPGAMVEEFDGTPPARLRGEKGDSHKCSGLQEGSALNPKAANLATWRCGRSASTRSPRPPPLPEKAHQRLVREAHTVTAPPSADLDIGRATVRPISVQEAQAVIRRFEYLGTMPALTRVFLAVPVPRRARYFAVRGPACERKRLR